MSLSELTGHPFTDVNDWLFETEKKNKKDPGLPNRPDNIRTDTESELPAPKIAKVLQRLVHSVNSMLVEIAKVPPLENRIIALETSVATIESTITTIESTITTLATQSELTAHTSLMSPSPGGHSAGIGGSGGTNTDGGRRGGKLKHGGSSSEKERIIAAILELQG